MKNLVYDINGAVVVLALFACVVLTLELGFRAGRRSGLFPKEYRDHVFVVQATMLGLLALLIGFTFQASMQRWDAQSVAIVREANALVKTYMRSTLLAPPLRERAYALLSTYAKSRVEEGRLTMADHKERGDLHGDAMRMQEGLWDISRTTFQGGGGWTAFMYADAVNELAGSLKEREQALARHVPEPILGLLFVAFLVAGAVVGYVSGGSGHRPAAVCYVLAGVIALLLFVIVDMDRPRRGLINVSQQSMVEAQQLIRAAGGQASPR